MQQFINTTVESMERTMQNTSEAAEESANAEDLLMVKEFLSNSYELRNNVVAGRLEFRRRDGTDSPFRQLTCEAENSIILDAMQTLGMLKGLKNMLTLLLHSNEVAEYDPVREYLTNLPRWDGQNRVAELFGRLPGISSENIYRCSIWMRSAVAHWLKMDQLHGNETVPTLIGDQGCGKTIFCRRLLPPSLQGYFLDRMNLSNKFDKDMALTNNMLVVLDEFDQYTNHQQASLKQALSRNTVNARPIFKGTQVVRHRYASFLATTNNLQPLNDPTGSRRYICIRIEAGALINNELPIDYDQLYAQVVEEVCERDMRYWFTAEETRQIQMDNVPFLCIPDIGQMVKACFHKPHTVDGEREHSMDEILGVIIDRYPYLKPSKSLKMRVGSMLSKMGYPSQHHKSGNFYVLLPKKAA